VTWLCLTGVLLALSRALLFGGLWTGLEQAEAHASGVFGTAQGLHQGTLYESALRRVFRVSLDCELETATTLGLDHIGVPMSTDAIASLFGVAKHHGVGETQDAAGIALRLPALCGLPTRREAKQVLAVSVARQQALTDQLISLTKQRREPFAHPERLESLNLAQGTPPVERIASPKNRSDHQNISHSAPFSVLLTPLSKSPQ
jgi:hypothetical protein